LNTYVQKKPLTKNAGKGINFVLTFPFWISVSNCVKQIDVKFNQQNVLKYNFKHTFQKILCIILRTFQWKKYPEWIKIILNFQLSCFTKERKRCESWKEKKVKNKNDSKLLFWTFVPLFGFGYGFGWIEG